MPEKVSGVTALGNCRPATSALAGALPAALLLLKTKGSAAFEHLPMNNPQLRLLETRQVSVCHVFRQRTHLELRGSAAKHPQGRGTAKTFKTGFQSILLGVIGVYTGLASAGGENHGLIYK